MKHIINLLILTVLFVGCDALKPIDKKAEDYVSKIESSKSTMTESDWEKADKVIEDMQQNIELSRNSMRPEELEHANKAIGRYYALRVKSNLNELKNTLEDVQGQLKGFVEELVDTTVK